MIRSRSLIMVHPTGFEPRSTSPQDQRSDINSGHKIKKASIHV